MWTLEDQEKGWCAPSDVGKEKLDHERWTLAELEAKGLPSYLLGTIKPPSTWSNAPESLGPNTDSPLDLQSALQAAYVKMGSEKAFTDWAKKNPSLVYPMIAKLGVAQVAKSAPPSLPDLDALTDEDIRALNSDDLKRIFLKGTLGITRKSELEGLGTSEN